MPDTALFAGRCTLCRNFQGVIMQVSPKYLPSIPQGGGKELRNRIGVGSLGLKGWRSVGTPQIVGVSGVRKLSQRISRQIQNEQGLNLREKPFGPQHFNPSQLCAESVKYVEARYECYCREL